MTGIDSWLRGEGASEFHPQQQGLKPNGELAKAKDIKPASEFHPQQQGLKPGSHVSAKPVIVRLRVPSTTTRIETVFHTEVIMPPLYCLRVPSTTTRIETLA